MSIYAVIDKATGHEAYRYESELPTALHEMGFDTHDHVVQPTINADGSIEGSSNKRRLTKLDFIEKLGDDAFIAILQMAKSSPQIEAWVEKMKLTTPDPDMTSVNLDDTRTIEGIQAIGVALESQGVVSPGWADGVLA